MYEPRVISINPGKKTLGELNYPSGHPRREGGVRYEAQESAGLSPVVFDRHDVRRPGISMLVMRVACSLTAIWCSFLIPYSVIRVSMIVLAALTVTGLMTRIAAGVQIVLAFLTLFNVATTPLLAEALTAAAAIAAFGAITILSGPGRFSLDCLLWNRSKN